MTDPNPEKTKKSQETTEPADTKKDGEVKSEEKKEDDKSQSKFKFDPSKVAKPVDNVNDKDQNVDDSHQEAPSAAVQKEDIDEKDNEVLFNDKSILYRLSEDEWKERGQGYIKILKARADGKYRVVMRRANIFKICANHFILPHMEIAVHKSSEKSVYWKASDFADGEVSEDTLLAKFKSPEVAKKFMEVFNQAKTPAAK